MNDDRKPDDAVVAIQFKEGVEAVVRGFPRGVGGDVAEGTDVPFRSVIGCAVDCVVGIEVTARRCAIGCATIALFVDVKSVIAFL